MATYTIRDNVPATKRALWYLAYLWKKGGNTTDRIEDIHTAKQADTAIRKAKKALGWANDSKTKTAVKVKQAPEPVANEAGVKVGDVFHCGYGYDMCLNAFFQVTKVYPKKIEVQEIRSEFTEGGANGQGRERALVGQFIQGEQKLTRLPSKVGEKVAFKVDNYRYAYRISDPEHETFYYDDMD